MAFFDYGPSAKNVGVTPLERDDENSKTGGAADNARWRLTRSLEMDLHIPRARGVQFLFTACAALFIASCASTDGATEAPPFSPSAPLPDASDSGSADSVRGRFRLPSEGYEIVSSLLKPGVSYEPKDDGMPTGVVLLNSSNRNKNRQVCNALFSEQHATVATEAEARAEDPDGDFLVTYWLTLNHLPQGSSCAAYLDDYHYDRAAYIRRVYGIGEDAGPVFLAIDASGETLFLDLTDASELEVFRATSDWMELALTVAETGERPDRNRNSGIVQGINRLFGSIVNGYASLVNSRAERPIEFYDPVSGRTRTFNVYLASSGYRIGSTFEL